MYRLTNELFETISKLDVDCNFGFIDGPHSGAVGTEKPWILEQDYETDLVAKGEDGVARAVHYKPEFPGNWLYRNHELTEGDFRLGLRDPLTGTTQPVVLKNVVVYSPHPLKRFEAPLVRSLKELLRLEPGLRRYFPETLPEDDPTESDVQPEN